MIAIECNIADSNRSNSRPVLYITKSSATSLVRGVIAARVVEIASGLPYEEFLHKPFFDPLGMTETTFWPSEAQIARLAGAYGPNKDKSGYARGDIGFLTKPFSDRVPRFPEAGGGLFSTTHDIFRYGLMLANDGELDGKRYLSHTAMDELRKE